MQTRGLERNASLLGSEQPTREPLRSEKWGNAAVLSPVRPPAARCMSRLARTVDLAASAFLRLSSRGEALVAELLRLSDHIPRLFLLQDKPEQKAYGDVLLDFRYLKTPELFEHRIESSAELVARDEDVWENHGGTAR